MSSIPVYIQKPESARNEELLHNHKVVAVAGTAEPLVASSTPCHRVLIQAKTSNTANVYIGGDSVPNTQAGGIVIGPGNAIQLDVLDLAHLYVNASVNNEGVTFIYWKQ